MSKYEKRQNVWVVNNDFEIQIGTVLDDNIGYVDCVESEWVDIKFNDGSYIVASSSYVFNSEIDAVMYVNIQLELKINKLKIKQENYKRKICEHFNMED